MVPVWWEKAANVIGRNGWYIGGLNSESEKGRGGVARAAKWNGNGRRGNGGVIGYDDEFSSRFFLSFLCSGIDGLQFHVSSLVFFCSVHYKSE